MYTPHINIPLSYTTDTYFVLTKGLNGFHRNGTCKKYHSTIGTHTHGIINTQPAAALIYRTMQNIIWSTCLKPAPTNTNKHAKFTNQKLTPTTTHNVQTTRHLKQKEDNIPGHHINTYI